MKFYKIFKAVFDASNVYKIRSRYLKNESADTSQENQHSKSDMHFIIIQLAAQQIGGHNDGGFMRYSKSDGVQKGQERRS